MNCSCRRRNEFYMKCSRRRRKKMKLTYKLCFSLGKNVIPEYNCQRFSKNFCLQPKDFVQNASFFTTFFVENFLISLFFFVVSWKSKFCGMPHFLCGKKVCFRFRENKLKTQAGPRFPLISGKPGLSETNAKMLKKIPLLTVCISTYW